MDSCGKQKQVIHFATFVECRAALVLHQPRIAKKVAAVIKQKNKKITLLTVYYVICGLLFIVHCDFQKNKYVP